jgi:hypothetical protein
MPDSYFQLSRQNQASALAAGTDFSGRAPHVKGRVKPGQWGGAKLGHSTR